MDPGKLEYYEFLDLSDIDENERQQLKQTLFSESTPDFLQLPWANHNFVTEEWQKETYDDEPQHMPNGPLDPSNCIGSPPLVEPSRAEPPSRVAQQQQHMPAVTMYSQPPPQAYTMPPPSPGYQHPQNVFVSNVPANVHGYYMQPHHYSMPEPPDLSSRGHRGRSRGRGNKRNDIRMEAAMVETSSAPGYGQQFVQIPYHPTAYYTQTVGSPMQHPSAQHATGSPLYIAPMYTHMYGAYHAHAGAQYYPPPSAAHVSAVMEDPVPEMADMNLEPPQNQVQPMFQQISEDYEAPQNVVSTTVIVNSSMDPANCDLNPGESNNTGYMNNVIPEVHENKPVTSDLSSIETVKTEPVVRFSASDVASNNNKPFVDNVVRIVQVKPGATNPVVTLPKVAQPPQSQHIVEPAPVTVNNNVQIEPEVTVGNDEKFREMQETVSVNVEPEPLEKAPDTPVPSGKSWASLFNKSGPQMTASQNATPSEVNKSATKPLVLNSPFPKSSEDKQTENAVAESRPAHSNLSIYSNDPISHRMGEFLLKYTMDNRTVSLQPRGLSNRSNYCYINSILQALLACPPFYNLLKALPHQPRKNPNGKSPTPIIDSLVEFVNEFTPLSAESRLNRKEKGQRKDNIDVICGTAFEPSRIYKILNGIRTDTFVVEGRQEDAEEFFGCLLNGLNDEMLELTKLVDEGPSTPNLSNGDIATNGETHDQDEIEWKVMGPKNKGSITRRADFGRTPISDIFRGQLRSRVHRTGDQITDNVQPFFTLQLDIEKATSVYEALELLVNKDKLEGVTCSRTNQQVEAWQQVTIEELPLVMVLHLKCFNYKLDVCSKIIKALEFPIDLKIDAKLLSSKAKYNSKQKQYKLFAVVYHDGKEASKGHYLTDAYHVGYGGWVRYDDAVVKSVQEQHVLHPNVTRVPYLLYYRRCDTIGNQQQNSTKRD